MTIRLSWVAADGGLGTAGFTASRPWIGEYARSVRRKYSGRGIVSAAGKWLSWGRSIGDRRELYIDTSMAARSTGVAGWTAGLRDGWLAGWLAACIHGAWRGGGEAEGQDRDEHDTG